MQNVSFSAAKFAALALAMAMTVLVQGSLLHSFTAVSGQVVQQWRGAAAVHPSRVAMASVALPAVTISGRRERALPANAPQAATPVAQAELVHMPTAQ